MLVASVGNVRCTDCGYEWVRLRQRGRCAGCDHDGQLFGGDEDDAPRGNEYCVDCMTYGGDGVKHGSVCAGPDDYVFEGDVCDVVGRWGKPDMVNAEAMESFRLRDSGTVVVYHGNEEHTVDVRNVVKAPQHTCNTSCAKCPACERE